MDNFIPKGLTLEKTNDEKKVIRTEKKELVFSDYFGIVFCCFGFIFWIFGLINNGFSDSYMMFTILFFSLVGYLMIGLIFSFLEKQIITITDEFIEIDKIRPVFSIKQTIDRKLIEKIDFIELRFPTYSVPSILIMMKYSFNLGYYKIPRIRYKNEDIYILEHYKKSIRNWIVEYLND